MAVYTDVSDEALAQFLDDYDLGVPIAFRGIAEGVENSNYMLRTRRDSGACDYILTLYERRVDPAELPWFLGLMQHLASHGLACPRPVPARDGSSLRLLAGRHAAITTFLPGVWPRRVRQAHCQPVGAALAALHQAGAGFTETRANSLGPAAWTPLLDSCQDRADEVLPGLAALLDTALRSILAEWPSRLPRGQIHADLFPDNVFFLDGTVSGLIDFYFACTDLCAYDIAVCLNAWCFEPDFAFNVTKARALLRGYETVRPLGGDERAALPVLARGAAMRFLLTRLYDWLNHPVGALVVRKDPLEYLKRLRFHLDVKSAAAYGV